MMNYYYFLFYSLNYIEGGYKEKPKRLFGFFELFVLLSLITFDILLLFVKWKSEPLGVKITDEIKHHKDSCYLFNIIEHFSKFIISYIIENKEAKTILNI